MSNMGSVAIGLLVSILSCLALVATQHTGDVPFAPAHATDYGIAGQPGLLTYNGHVVPDTLSDAAEMGSSSSTVQQSQAGQQFQAGQQTHTGQQFQAGQQTHTGQQFQAGQQTQTGQQSQAGQPANFRSPCTKASTTTKQCSSSQKRCWLVKVPQGSVPLGPTGQHPGQTPGHVATVSGGNGGGGQGLHGNGQQAHAFLLSKLGKGQLLMPGSAGQPVQQQFMPGGSGHAVQQHAGQPVQQLFMPGGSGHAIQQHAGQPVQQQFLPGGSGHAVQQHAGQPVQQHFMPGGSGYAVKQQFMPGVAGQPAQQQFMPGSAGQPVQQQFMPGGAGQPVQQQFMPGGAGQPVQQQFMPGGAGQPVQQQFMASGGAGQPVQQQFMPKGPKHTIQQPFMPGGSKQVIQQPFTPGGPGKLAHPTFPFIKAGQNGFIPGGAGQPVLQPSVTGGAGQKVKQPSPGSHTLRYPGSLGYSGGVSQNGGGPIGPGQYVSALGPSSQSGSGASGTGHPGYGQTTTGIKQVSGIGQYGGAVPSTQHINGGTGLQQPMLHQLVGSQAGTGISGANGQLGAATGHISGQQQAGSLGLSGQAGHVRDYGPFTFSGHPALSGSAGQGTKAQMGYFVWVPLQQGAHYPSHLPSQPEKKLDSPDCSKPGGCLNYNSRQFTQPQNINSHSGIAQSGPSKGISYPSGSKIIVQQSVGPYASSQTASQQGIGYPSGSQIITQQGAVYPFASQLSQSQHIKQTASQQGAGYPSGSPTVQQPGVSYPVGPRPPQFPGIGHSLAPNGQHVQYPSLPPSDHVASTGTQHTATSQIHPSNGKIAYPQSATGHGWQPQQYPKTQTNGQPLILPPLPPGFRYSIKPK